MDNAIEQAVARLGMFQNLFVDPEGAGDPLVEVHRAATAPEARAAVAALGAHGIVAATRGEALGEVFGLAAGPLAEVVVLVPSSQAARAREILAGG